ncbi:MAG: serine hydrolase domain-containing protein [Oceanicaulis sp.]
MIKTLVAALALTFAQAEEPAAPPPAPDTRAAELEAYVDGLAAAWMSDDPIPGLVVSVVDADSVLLSKGYGLADIETGAPVSAKDTRFEIGSISKTFVWTAVMMLEEQGALDLHADVNGYLQGYQVPAAERPLTLADLMSHRTGLEDTLALFLPGIDARPIEDALAAAEPAAVHERGGATAYSNWGSALAAKIVADVSGRPYEDFLYSEILAPLGMTDTTFREGDRTDAQPDLAVSYDADEGFLKPAFRLDQGAFAPAGSIASTAADMARWMRFHLNGGELDGVRLLSAETHARMQERLYPGREGGADMAHGFMQQPYRDQTLWGHGGAINSFLSYMAIARPEGVGVFVSQSGTAASPYRRLPHLVIDRLTGRAPVNAPPAGRLSLDAESLAEYEGRYTPNRRTFEGFEKIITGVGAAEITAAEDGLIMSGGGESERYWPLAEDVFESRLGDRIVFQRDESGAVIRIADESGTNSFDPVTATTDPNLLMLAFAPAVFFSLTVWLGLWRRLGKDQAVTARGRLVSTLDLVSALAVFGLVGAFVVVAASFADFGLEFVEGYPHPPLIAIAVLAKIVFAAAALVIVATWPAFFGSDWSIWRKLHHLLFAAALAFLGWALWSWDLVTGWPITP